MHIAIEGNIGSGKSTLLRRFGKERKDYKIVEEKIDDWKFLSKFYGDMKRYAFTFNVEVLLSFDRENDEKDVLYERSLLSNHHVFAKTQMDDGFMSEEEYDMYQKIYNKLFWKVDAIIYVRTDPEKAYERLIARNRRCEKGVTLEYIKKIDEAYENMIRQCCAERIIEIDGNRAENEVYQDLLKSVDKIVSSAVVTHL